MMDILSFPFMEQPLWMWLVFFTLVGSLLAFDLGVAARKPHVVSFKESMLTTLGFMAVATFFGVWIAYELGGQSATLFATGYVVEFSLSMDNVFVMAMILKHFKVPAIYQHKVLFWGILGVVVLRGLMIGVGTVVVERFHAVLYIFAVFLVWTGLKMLWASLRGGDDHGADVGHSSVFLLLQKYGRVAKEFHEGKFWVRLKDANTGRMALYMTPLLAALIMVELADVMFAVDSVPAIFAITTDPFLVFTSNILAILGLRALYFTLAGMMQRFVYLDVALALILTLIGVKMLLVGLGVVEEVSPLAGLGVIALILGGGIGASLWKTRRG